MTDLNDSLDLAKKLAGAAPIDSEEPVQQADLSSSYLSTGNSNAGAFLSNATIDNQISKVTQIAEESMQSISNANPNIYDEEAEAKAKEREERIKAEAEAKIKAEQEAKEREIKRAERAEQIRDFLIGKSEKDKKLGYSRGVISGILLTLFTSLLGIIIGVCFFKQELIKFIDNGFDNYINGESSILSPTFLIDKLNISEKLPLTNNDDANKIINIDNIFNAVNTLAFDYVNQHFNTNENITINNNIAPMELNLEESNDYDSSDLDNSIEVEDNSEGTIETDTTIEAESIGYSATHTDSESFANRVMTPDCDRLSCGDFTKLEENSDFTLCTTFKRLENLSDDDARIGKNGNCRYRDESELFFLSNDNEMYNYINEQQNEEEVAQVYEKMNENENDQETIEENASNNIEQYIAEEKADTYDEESAL